MKFLPGIKVSILAVSSLDNIIARQEADTIEWSSSEDKKFLKEFLDQCDLCIMGRKSYQLSEAYMNKRHCVVFTRNLPPINDSQKIDQNGSILSYINPELVELESWLAENFRFPKKTVAILGGPAIYRYFIDRRWVDDIYLTIEPLIFGKGLSWISSGDKHLDTELRLISANQLNSKGTVLLHYCVKSSRN